MEVKIVLEAGYEQAMEGLAYSFTKHIRPIAEIAGSLVGRGRGEDKFLRQIQVWVRIRAPRFWWSEFDTYKVGTVAQSASTMHSIKKELLTSHDFEYPVPFDYLDYLNALIIDNAPVQVIKNALPEGYLQKRMVVMNYANLQNMILQRCRHRLPQWRFFVHALYMEAAHRELLPAPEELKLDLDWMGQPVEPRGNLLTCQSAGGKHIYYIDRDLVSQLLGRVTDTTPIL